MFKFGKKKVVSSAEPERTNPKLVLLISAGKIKASIWSLEDRKIQILGMGEKTYSSEGKEQHLEYKTIRDALADAIDIACNVAETDVHETTFGIPQSWMRDQALSEEYEEIVEKINQDLDVEGVAYVSIPHAISFLLQYLHKIPPTTFLVGTTREGASLSYVEVGKIVETHNIAWSGTKVGENIAKGLKLFKNIGEAPSSVYLYGFGNLILAQKELEGYNWSQSSGARENDKPTFMAVPQIYVLDEHVDIYATSLVGAKDFARLHQIKGRLDLEVPQIIRSLPNPKTVVEKVEMLSSNKESFQQDTTPTSEPSEELDKNVPEPNPLPPMRDIDSKDPFGFVKNANIVDYKLKTPDKQEQNKPLAPPLKADNFAHVATIAPIKVEDEISKQDLEPGDTSFVSEDGIDQSEEDIQEISNTIYTTQKPRKRIAFNGRPIITLLVIIVILLGLIGFGAVYAYVNFPTASVTIFVKPDTLTKRIEVTASEQAEVSFDDKTIPLQKVTIDLEESLTADTTGTNTVGEKAEGTFIIYNKTTNEQSIKKGTTLKIDNLEFITDSDVSIASASATIEGQTNGKSEVSGTAVQIGEKSNIKKGATLSVGTYSRSELEAEAKDDFTGGSEKQVKVVTAKDITALRQQLEKTIEAKIPQTVRQKVSSSEILFDKAWEYEDPKFSYNKKAGDEAVSVEGKAYTTITAYVISESNIKSLLSQVATDSVPQGYEKQSDNEEFSTEFIELKNGEVTFYASSSITIVPILDSQSIINSIVGKKEEAARASILEDNRIFDVRIDYSLNLPEPILTLPQKRENITVKRSIRDVAI